MADNIPTPVADGLLIATDEVTSDGDLAHAQFVKIMDGAAGSATAMRVHADGSVPAADATRFAGSLASGTPATAGGYTAGELICDPIDLGVQPPGAYTRMRLVVASLDGTTLPEITVVLVPLEVADDGSSLGADGAAPTLPDGPIGLVRCKAVAGSAFVPHALTPSAAVWDQPDTTAAQVTDGVTLGADVQLFALLVAGETFVTDLTAGVGIGLYAAVIGVGL